MRYLSACRQARVWAFLLLSATLVFGVAQPAKAAGKLDYSTLSPERRLAYVSGLLRLAMATSIDDGLARLPKDEARVVANGLGLSAGRVDRAWSWVVAPAAAFQQVNGDTARTYWWNPAIDAGIAMTWRRDGILWRITGAAPILGETLRGEPLAFNGAPAWSAGADPLRLGASLAKTSWATRRAMAGPNLRAGLRRPIPADAVLGRAGVVDGGLQGTFDMTLIRRNAEARRTIARPVRRLAVPDRSAIGAELARLSDAERRMFAARLKVSNGGRATVLWTSTGVPDKALLLHYAADSSIEPSTIEAIDLSAQSGGGR